MSIDATQFRELIIRPTLQIMDLHSEAAENLLMGTAAQESHLGTYLRQLGGGPAMGVFQMEPATHDDIWSTYLHYRPHRARPVQELVPTDRPSAWEMIPNLAYATAMARLLYFRIREPLPAAGDIEALAHYWKRYYNTRLGRGTVEEFLTNYERYVQ